MRVKNSNWIKHINMLGQEDILILEDEHEEKTQIS